MFTVVQHTHPRPRIPAVFSLHSNILSTGAQLLVCYTDPVYREDSTGKKSRKICQSSKPASEDLYRENKAHCNPFAAASKIRMHDINILSRN